MKKTILIPLMLIMILALFSQVFADTLVIGTGTSTQRYPLGSYWGYERSAAIYTDADLGSLNLAISSVAWYSTIATTAAVPTKIYLKTTTATTLTADTWANMISGAALLYDGIHSSTPAGDWNEFILTSTFYVDDGYGLLVLVERNYGGNGSGTAGGSSGGPGVRYTSVTNTHQYWQADYDPPAGTGTVTAYRPNVKITYTPYTITYPPNPAVCVSPVNGATNVPLTQTLNWAAGGGAPTGYKLSFGTVSPYTTIINQSNVGNVTTYAPTLNYSTQYWWQVIPYNAYGDAQNCPIWTFTTMEPPLTGTKTIGTGGNYANFTAAINALNTSGVGTGGVTFNVLAGSVFEENVPVITATGTAANSIIFQKSGTGANPVIKPSSATAGIQIKGGDYITFDGIDITRPTGSTSYYGYYLLAASATDGAQHNTIKNCKITLDRTNSSCYGIYQYYSVTPTASSGTNSYNTYENIVVENAYNGIRIYQSSSTYPDESNVIRNCTIGGSTAGDIAGPYGIYTYYQKNLTVAGNTIRNVGYATSSVYGLYIYYGSGSENVINGNRIYNIAMTGTSTYSTYGLYVYPSSSGTVAFIIYNNMIWGLSNNYTTATTSFYLHGIYLSSSTNVTYYVDFNSVRIEGPANISNDCLYLTATTGIHYIRNNIFANVSPGHSTPYHVAIYTPSTSSIGATGSVSNNNVLYIENLLGGYVVRGSSTNYATLQAWTTASSQDTNSRPTNPQFDSANPLNILTNAPTPVEGRAMPVAWVTTDIYGTTRNATTPDIGAHEGNFMQEQPCQTPVAQPTNLILIPYSTSIDGSFTASNPAAEGYLVVRHSASTLTFSPADGTYYTPGQSVGTNEVIVNASSATSFSATGLTVNTQYYFTVFAMNLNGIGAPKYNRTNPLTGTQTTLPAAPAAPAAFTATAVSSSQINLSATANAVGDNIMVAWNTNSTFGTPLATGYSVGSPIAGGGTVLYMGPASGLSSHTGLTQATTYYYKAWSYITVERTTYYAFSTTGLTASATTHQIAATLPFMEDFEVWPHNWSVLNGTQTNKWWVGTATAYAGNQSAYISDSADGSTYNYVNTASIVHMYREIIFPQNALEYELSFMFKCYGESSFDGLKVYLVDLATVPVAGTEVATGQIGNTWYNQTPGYNWTKITIPLSNVGGTTKRLVFSWKNDTSVANQPPAAIDNVEVIAYYVPRPTNLTVTNITETSAVLDWTSAQTSFDLQWGSLGFALGTGTIVNNISHPYSLSGLTAATGYSYYVRAKEGSNYSAWAGPYNFYTAFPVPYTTNFDASTDLPAGWTKVIDSPSTSANVTISTTTPHSSPNNVYMYNPASNQGALVSLVTPAFNVNLNTLYIKFWARGTANRNLYIGVVDNLNPTATFTQMAAIPLSTTYTQYVVDFATYAGTGHYISFRLDTSDTVSQYVYLDDVTIAPRPWDELAITSFTATPLYKFTDTEFTFNITVKNNGTNSSGQNIVIKKGEIIIGTVPIGTLNCLSSANLSYNWSSNEAGTFTFTAELPADNDLTNNTATLANVEIYTKGKLAEGFESEVFPPVRWVTWQGTGQNAWQRTTASNYDGVAAAGLVLTATNNTSYIATPQLTFSTPSDSIYFYARATSAGRQLQAYYGLSTDGTGYTALGSPISLTTTYTRYTVPGTAALYGNYRIALQGLPNGAAGTIYLDKVIGPMIYIPPEAPGPAVLVNPPENAVVDPTTLVFSWTAPVSGGLADGYYVRVLCDSLNYLIENDDQATENAFYDITEDLSYNVYGSGYLLNYNSVYYWQIIPYSEEGGRAQLSQCLPRKFTTIKQISAPSSINLGNMWAGRTKTGTITVQNVSPTSSLTFNATGTNFTFNPAGPYTIPANSSYELSFTLAVPETEGPYNGQIILTQTYPEPGAEVTVQVTGTIVPAGLVAIGTGTNTALNLPIYAYYGYNYSQSIYLQSDIQLTGSWLIKKLYYFWDGAYPGTNSKDWTVYMGNTSKTVFTNTSDFVPLTQLTPVFSGTVNLPQVSGGCWVEINLNPYFSYTGQNLVVAVHENTPGYDSSYGHFYCTSSTNVSVHYYRDASDINLTNPMDGSPNNSVKAGYPNVKMIFSEIPPEPVFTITPSETEIAYPLTIINQTSTKQFTITNGGMGTLTINSVQVSGNYFSLAENITTNTLNFNQSTTFKVAYTPTVPTTGSEIHSGYITITYGEPLAKSVRAVYQIHITGTCVDPRIYPPYTQNFDSVTAPALPLGWTGYVSTTSSYPTSVYVKTSTTYPVSLPNSIVMYNYDDTAADLRLISPQVIVPLNRVKVKFSARGGSAGYTLLVGTNSTAAGTGTFTQISSIALTDAHTIYTVSLANYTGTDQYLCFKHGLGGTYYSIYIDDIVVEELVNNDLAVTQMTGPGHLAAGSSGTYSVTVNNNGLLTQSNFVLQLRKVEDDSILSSTTITGVNLLPDATATYDIVWSPQTVGTYNIYAKIILTGDTNPYNDNSAPKTVVVWSSGTYFPLAGNPATTSTSTYFPICYYYKNSVSETIYTSQELQMTGGTIQGIFYYCTSTTGQQDKPIKIWMKNTTASSVENAFLPFSDYVLVANTNITIPVSTQPVEVFIPLSVPFNYTGNNLAVRVNRPMDTGWTSGTNFYYHSLASTDYRTRYMYSDTYEIDPANPDASTSVTQYKIAAIPLTMFVVTNATPVVLSAPVVTITTTTTGVQLSWNQVPNAQAYRIYVSDDPYNFPAQSPIVVQEPTHTYQFNTAGANRKFFKVIAVSTYRNEEGKPDVVNMINPNPVKFETPELEKK